MDIDAMGSVVKLVGDAFSLMKNAKDLLPDGPTKEAATQKLIEAEKGFRIAEAKAAHELGYKLCKCTWPPQIMLQDSSGHFSCPECSKSSGESTDNIPQVSSLPTPTQTQQLSEEEHTILKLMLDWGDEGMRVETVATELVWKVPKAEYYLDKMQLANYLEVDLDTFDPSGRYIYFLAQRGREYLIESGDM